MQINKISKNMSNVNSIGDVAAKAKQKNQGENVFKNNRDRVMEESFQDSLQKSMNTELNIEMSLVGANGEGEEWAESPVRASSSIISHKEQGFGKSKAESINIHVGRSGDTALVKETAVRQLSYGECDKVEINVLEGYTLKAKLEKGAGESKADEYSIYVEMKNEKGIVKARLFDGIGLQKDSENAMERIAYAVMYDREEM